MGKRILLLVAVAALAVVLDACLSTLLFARPEEFTLPFIRLLVPLSRSYQCIDIRDLPHAPGQPDEKPRILVDLHAPAGRLMRVYVPGLGYELPGVVGDSSGLPAEGALTQDVLLRYLRAGGARDSGSLESEAGELFGVIGALASGRHLSEVERSLEYYRAEQPVFRRSVVNRPWAFLVMEGVFWGTLVLLFGRVRHARSPDARG